MSLLDLLDHVTYFNIMMYMDLEDLKRLYYSPNSSFIHREIYEGNTFWMKRAIRDFSLAQSCININDLDSILLNLNWKYIYAMLHKTHKTLPKQKNPAGVDRIVKYAFIEAVNNLDQSGANTLGKFISTTGPLHIIMYIINHTKIIRQVNTFKCAIIAMHDKINNPDHKLVEEIFKIEMHQAFMTAFFECIDFVIDPEIIIKHVLNRMWSSSLVGLIINRCSKVDLVLFVQSVKDIFCMEHILEHMVRHDTLLINLDELNNAVFSDNVSFLSQERYVAALINYKIFTVDLLMFSLKKKIGRILFEIMFDALFDKLTTEELSEILFTTQYEYPIIKILESKLVPLDDSVFEKIKLSTPSIIKALSNYDSVDPSCNDCVILHAAIDSLINGNNKDVSLEIINLLLEDPRFFVSDAMITLAKDHSIIGKLIAHPSVDKATLQKNAYKNKSLNNAKLIYSDANNFDPMIFI